MTDKLDFNHNEFFNSEDLLEQGFRKAMKEKGYDIPEDPTVGTRSGRFSSGQEETDGMNFFMTSRPGASGEMRTEVVREGEVSTGELMKFASAIEKCKDEAIEIFETVSSDPAVSSRVESLIRRIETIAKACGMEVKKFEPLRHMSGLKSRDILENANRVLDNTKANYDTHIISAMQSFMNGQRPGIKIKVVGEHGGRGFTAAASVVAKNDFGGSEAIDYVHATPRGLFSIKRFERNRWVDVSDDFEIKFKVAETDLQTDDEMPHSIFVGEKIASEGKDILVKFLKLNEEDVKFGSHQIFASSKEIIDGIRKTIKSSG